MSSVNKVFLMGNLTRDPEIRHTPAGTAVCDLGVAVNERVKVNDQWQDRAHFFDVTCWARTAEVANEYLRKGSPLHVEGKLSFEQWEKDGQKRSKVKVVCERLQLLGSKNEHDQSQAPRQERAEQQQGPPPSGEVPF